MVYEKKNRSLVFSGSRKIPTLGSTVHWETRQASFPTGTVGPRVGIFLSPLNTNDGFYLSRISYAYLTWVAMWDRFFRRRAYIGITRSCMPWYVRKDFLSRGKFSDRLIRFASKPVLSKKKKNQLLCEVRIEKSVPRDHRLSTLGKPRDAKRRSSGRMFLFYPHTHDRFLIFSTLPHHLRFTSIWEQLTTNTSIFTALQKFIVETKRLSCSSRETIIYISVYSGK